MKQALHKLTALQLTKMQLGAKGNQLLSDGGGLYLRVGASGSASWVAIYNRQGKRTELGLGSYPATTLANARQQAAQIRTQLAEGLDPKVVRQRAACPTLSQVTENYIDVRGGDWSAGYAGDFRRSINVVFADFAKRRVDSITVADIERSIRQRIKDHPAGARNDLKALSQVMGYATALQLIPRNLAAYRGNLEHILPVVKHKVQHHAAIPYAQAPALLASLLDAGTMVGRAIAWQLLTGVRPNEARDAMWSEIDGDVWVIPGSRMKTKKPHIVPLSPFAVKLLAEWQKDATTDEIFPGAISAKSVPVQTCREHFKKLAPEYTMHGLRSTLRQFLGAETDTAFEVAEEILGHSVGNAVTRAYLRSQLVEKGRGALTLWSDFLTVGR